MSPKSRTGLGCSRPESGLSLPALSDPFAFILLRDGGVLGPGRPVFLLVVLPCCSLPCSALPSPLCLSLSWAPRALPPGGLATSLGHWATGCSSISPLRTQPHRKPALFTQDLWKQALEVG